MLAAARELGVPAALDNFGAGYSSLSLLLITAGSPLPASAPRRGPFPRQPSRKSDTRYGLICDARTLLKLSTVRWGAK